MGSPRHLLAFQVAFGNFGQPFGSRSRHRDGVGTGANYTGKGGPMRVMLR
jgi:hypothetical protein